MIYKSTLLTTITISFLCIFELRAQYDMGLFYTVVPDALTLNSDNENFTLYQHYINISGRREVYKRTYLGLDFSYCHLTGDNLINPFIVIGAYLDYILFFSKGISVSPRVGISQGNLSYAGFYSPTKRPVTSFILGISADIFLYRNFYLWTGIFNHKPLNRIPQKYSFAQPFLGIRYIFGK